MGERLDPPMGRRQAGQREEHRRNPGDRRQHVEELLGQGGVLGRCEPESDVLVQLEQQDSWPSPRRHAQRARHRVAGADQPVPPRRRRSTRASATSWSTSRRSASWTGRPITSTSLAPPPTPANRRCHARRRRTSRRRGTKSNPNSRTQFDNTDLDGEDRMGRRSPHQERRAVRPSVLRRSVRRAEQHVPALHGGRATQVRQFNTPTRAINVDKIFGVFFRMRGTSRIA